MKAVPSQVFSQSALGRFPGSKVVGESGASNGQPAWSAIVDVRDAAASYSGGAWA